MYILRNENGALQTVDYRYNIRGQVLSINNSKLSNDGGVTNADNNDLFGMAFQYDQQDGNLNNGTGNTPSFSGKLTGIKWMAKDGIGYERSYSITYDQLNRYTGETYAERTAASTGSFSNNFHGFDENNITYDAGGNLLTLTRNSSTEGTNSYTPIDNLTYTYGTSSTSNQPDQLYQVADATGNPLGFNNYTGAGSSSHYVYDANGNPTNDPYKGLAISYNYLNRTAGITVNSTENIFYTYDASGTLIRKQVYNSGGTLQTQTDYIDGFNYVNGTLSYFPMPEGRVVNNSGTLTQQFVITDQQGNARISFQDNGSHTAVVTQENSYYGFGLILPNSPVSPANPSNKQLYNGGSEWQNDYSNLPDYYQTYFRNYDAALGRFVGADPQAESLESMTTYQYAGNNPIMNNDPMGDKACVGCSINSTGYTNFGNNSFENSVGGGGADMSNPYDAIGQNSDPNWMNDGEFDDLGIGSTTITDPNDPNYHPYLSFSSDGGAAGRAFWAGAEGSGGKQPDYSSFWNTALSISYEIRDKLNGSAFEELHFSGQSIEALVNIVQNLASNQIASIFIFNTGSIGFGIFTILSSSSSYTKDGELYAGASVDLFFKGSGYDFTSYKWIQTASEYPNFVSKNGTVLSNPFSDGTMDASGNNLNDPFYYSDNELTKYNNYANSIGYDSYFSDRAGMTGVNGWFVATVTLVGIDSNGQMTSLGSFTWGYGIYGSGPAFPRPVTVSP